MAPEDMSFPKAIGDKQLWRYFDEAEIVIQLPQAARPRRFELAQQLDDLALLAKLDPVAAMGDKLAGGAQHIDDEDAKIGNHQAEHRRAPQPQGQRYAANGEDADVKDGGLGQRNQCDATSADQRGHHHANEDLLGRFGSVEPEKRRDQPHGGQDRDQNANGPGSRRELLGIFGIMAQAHSPNPAHEAEQKRTAEPQAKLEIVGRVAQANNHHGRGQDLDRNGGRNQAY